MSRQQSPLGHLQRQGIRPGTKAGEVTLIATRLVAILAIALVAQTAITSIRGVLRR
jgi:hypothetical protein